MCVMQENIIFLFIYIFLFLSQYGARTCDVMRFLSFIIFSRFKVPCQISRNTFKICFYFVFDSFVLFCFFLM